MSIMSSSRIERKTTTCRCGKLLRPNKDVLNRTYITFTALTQLVRRIGQVFGSHCAVRHKPVCTLLAKRKVREPDSFTNSLLEQAGGTIVEETREAGSKKGTGKSTIVRRTSTSSLHCGKCLRYKGTRVEYGLGGAICGAAKFRTLTTIIIFKLVTKPNMVEFVFLEPKWAEMALARVAGRHMLRPVSILTFQ